MENGLDPKELIATSETAREIGVSIGTVRWHADRGTLPCIRLLNGDRLFKRSEVVEFAAKRAARRASEK